MLKRRVTLFALFGFFVFGLALLLLKDRGSPHSDFAERSGSLHPLHRAQTEALAFADWATEGRVAQLEEAKDRDLWEKAFGLAERRREAMRFLIENDPQAALDLALSHGAYHALPDELKSRVERPFSERADIDVIAICGLDHDHANDLQASLRFADGSRYQLSVEGTERVGYSKKDIPVQGISLDGLAVARTTVFQQVSTSDLAWAENHLPLANHSPQTDFLTGEAISGAPLVAISGGFRFHFAHEASLQELEAALFDLDQRPGDQVGSAAFLDLIEAKQSGTAFPLQAFTDEQNLQSLAATTDTLDYLIIRADFPDRIGTPYSEEELVQLVTHSVAPALADYSYNKTSVSVVVTPSSYRLSQTSNYPNETGILDDAVAAYMGDGNPNPFSQYDFVAVSFPILFSGWAGKASVGGPEQWLQGRCGAETILHELGHNYGLLHANYWAFEKIGDLDTPSGSENPIDPNGVDEGYGDIFDTMGSGPLEAGHFHMAAKESLGWIEPDQWLDVTTATPNGVHRIYQFDDVSAEGIQGLRLEKQASGDHYWLGYRKKYPGISYLDRGAYLIWERAGSGAVYNQSWLVDTTPNSDLGKLDSAIALGRTYSDPASNLHITPVAAGADSIGSYIEVAINQGDFSNNLNPTGSLSAPSSAEARTAASFSFNGSDPDGDDLAFHWDFGDGTVETNSDSVDHTYATGGVFQLTLTVSDMKGGTFSAQQEITVGDPITEINLRDSTTSADLTAGASNGSLAVVAAVGGEFLRSSTGQIWSSSSLGFGNQNVRIEEIIWTGEQFLAAGSDYDFGISSRVGIVLASSDAISWQKVLVTDSAVGDWGFTALAMRPDDSTVAVAGSDSKIYYSSDLAQWSSVDLSETGWNASSSPSIEFVDGAFIYAAYEVNLDLQEGRLVLKETEDLAAFTDLAPNSGIEDWHGIRELDLLDGLLVASGFKLGIVHSFDRGENWYSLGQRGELEATTFAFGNGFFYAHGFDEEQASQNFVSLDGRIWFESIAPPGGISYNDRIFFQNTFISLADGGVIHQSDTFETYSDSEYQNWIAGFTTDSNSQYAYSNPDDDWAPNFMEYALGSDPTDSGSVPAPPEISVNESGAFVVNIYRLAKTDVTLSLEYSTDLSNWQTLGSIATIDREDLLELTTTALRADYDRFFIRIRASQ
ncbi:PKD domain-containing protein [Pelagicoccus sp. SDUM812003]|uniref:PKD domain-containing protein n=1 Tax=Pelagicoccus sp. SDUM812003 TaxID=3041267 RepID=UPI00280FCA36|nr:PKD domain-containing protein [Pelagicoccus sp. SDUM812003]MDQ8204433.1 PKD domain-containing protein [Pelagicoccus sp. SDUM812003]